MTFNIILFEGTDTIKFGMTHKEIWAILGKEPKLFKKTEFDLYMTEDYSDICHVYYSDLTCTAFEFFSPSQVFYKNTQLIGQNRENIEALFHGLDSYKSDSVSFSVYNGDFAFYAPENRIESVYISQKGYAEEQFDFFMKKYAEKYGG